MDRPDNVADVLEHYGVKGMKWGVRKRPMTPVGVTISQQPGKRVRAKGGENQPASEDAKQVAEYRQKAKRSTTDSLSTKELQTLVNRMNLEQQYSRMNQQNVSLGKKFMNAYMNNKQFRQQVSTQGGKALGVATAFATVGDSIKRVKL